jgi:hypothetical protein
MVLTSAENPSSHLLAVFLLLISYAVLENLLGVFLRAYQEGVS